MNPLRCLLVIGSFLALAPHSRAAAFNDCYNAAAPLVAQLKRKTAANAIPICKYAREGFSDCLEATKGLLRTELQAVGVCVTAERTFSDCHAALIAQNYKATIAASACVGAGKGFSDCLTVAAPILTKKPEHPIQACLSADENFGECFAASSATYGSTPLAISACL
ncbi:MAG TPA: hypothetical protein VM901_00740 [Bdellovibrionota bacterium]|nr:hypothetical protein [Bdellovibrionota bacterium]